MATHPSALSFFILHFFPSSLQPLAYLPILHFSFIILLILIIFNYFILNLLEPRLAQGGKVSALCLLDL